MRIFYKPLQEDIDGAVFQPVQDDNSNIPVVTAKVNLAQKLIKRKKKDSK